MSSIAKPIAALATGAGVAAIAIIRLSGDGSHGLLFPSLRFKKRDLSLGSLQGGKLYLCDFVVGEGPSLDELMVCFFKGKTSFTGEESAELYCHGSPFVTQKILSHLFSLGFREAEPGEFSKRAYLNGKMDLTAVEGLKGLIEAQSYGQWLAARQLMQGKLAEKVEQLRKTIIEALAYLEAMIDFPDEGETSRLKVEQIETKVKNVYDQIQTLLQSYGSGRIASQGLKVALVGSTNVGKSTLLNTLLGSERAIVSDIAGTTRDFLEERCLVNGRLVRLFDTAGLRHTHDPIENIGIEKTLEISNQADVVLLLMAADSTEEQRLQTEGLLKDIKMRSIVRVLTKSDLGVPPWAEDYLTISAKQDQNLSDLKNHLSKVVDQHVDVVHEQEFITSLRHVRALEDALTCLKNFFTALEQNAFDECLAFELQQTTKALKSIIGEVYGDDVLDKIFSEFCVGK